MVCFKAVRVLKLQDRVESGRIKSNKERRSKVGAKSEAQKAQNFFFWKKLVIFEKMFSFKKSRIVPKNVKGDPLKCINIHSVAKYEKTRRGDPFGTLKIFRKKSHSAEKNPKRGPFRHVRFCMFP